MVVPVVAQRVRLQRPGVRAVADKEARRVAVVRLVLVLVTV